MVQRTMKEELKFALTEFGELSAPQPIATHIPITYAGMSVMPKSSVVSLDTKNLVCDCLSCWCCQCYFLISKIFI